MRFHSTPRIAAQLAGAEGDVCVTCRTATTASNLIDQAANNYTGATRTWVRAAALQN